MTGVKRDLLAAKSVPDSHHTACIARRNAFPIRGPGHGKHTMRMIAIDIRARSANGIPDVDSLISRTRSDKVLAILTRNRRPGHSKYFVAVALIYGFNRHEQ